MVNASLPAEKRFVGRTAAQILKGRKIMPPIYPESDLIDIINEAKPTDAIVLDDKFAIKQASAQRFKRNAPVFRITKPMSAHDAVTTYLNPVKVVPETFSQVNNTYNRGYGWVGPDDSLRVIPLLYAVEGAELAVLDRDKIDVKRYGDKLDARHVPSRSDSEQFYHVMIGGVPFHDIGEKIFSEWVLLRSRTQNEAEKWQGELAQKRRRDDYLFVPQAIAAYHVAAGSPVKDTAPALNPFVIPTRELASFVDRMRNNVVVSYKKDNGEKEKRNLNGTEKEMFLWGRLRFYGYERNFSVDNSPLTLSNAAEYLVTGLGDKKSPI